MVQDNSEWGKDGYKQSNHLRQSFLNQDDGTKSKPEWVVGETDFTLKDASIYHLLSSSTNHEEMDRSRTTRTLVRPTQKSVYLDRD